MYIPEDFREQRQDVLDDAICSIGFATLVTDGKAGLEANHFPMQLDREKRLLRGHFARANPQWQNLKTESEALAIFLGPHAYVSPNWYPTTQQTGETVPTWNFLSVHVQGAITVKDDGRWLRTHLALLTQIHESARPKPWSLDDAPASYIQSMLRKIVGFEISISRMEGKWKLSQNRSIHDRQGVQQALSASAHARDHDLAKLMSGA